MKDTRNDKQKFKNKVRQLHQDRYAKQFQLSAMIVMLRGNAKRKKA